jgi:hypothetical protein
LADNTKQGPKDITDLKARLGLKKAGGPTSGPGPGVPAPFPTPMAGITPPAGAQRAGGGAPLPSALAGPPAPHAAPQGAIPPPPGFTPPPEAAPAQADPRRDPYAAQQAAVAANLAAFYTAGGALPGDGDSVKEGSKRPKPWAIIGAAGGAGLLFFFIGWAIGNISVSRNDYNITTEHAARIRDQVDKIHKQIEKAKEALKEIKLSDKDPPNYAGVEKLGEIDFKEPDMTRDLFHTNYFSFEPSVVQQVFTYYNDATTLSKQLAEHSVRTAKDKESIDKYVKGNAAKAEKGEKAYGVIVDTSQKIHLAQVVELLSAPGCEKTDGECKPEDMKMRFRTALGGEGQTRNVRGAPANVVYAIQPTELQKQAMSGDPGLLAFKDYVRRHVAIIQTMGRLAETEKQLLEGLKKRANQPQLFAL